MALSKIPPEYLKALSKESLEALADLALEDIHPNAEMLHELMLFYTGKITEKDYLKKLVERVKR